jgi:hypothetical protein
LVLVFADEFADADAFDFAVGFGIDFSFAFAAGLGVGFSAVLSDGFIFSNLVYSP